MRKCEIAVGVVDLLAIPLWIILLSHFADTAVVGSVGETVGIGISGGADGPTAIFLTSKISFVTVVTSPLVLSGILLLIPSRWRAIIILSVLLGFLHACIILISSTWIIDFYSHFVAWNAMTFYFFAYDLFELSLSIASMSLFFRRGVRPWLKKKDPSPSVEP